MRDPLQSVSARVKKLMSTAVYHFPQFGFALGFEESDHGDAITAAFCAPSDLYRHDVARSICEFRLEDGWTSRKRGHSRVEYCKREVVKNLLYNLGGCRDRLEARTLLFDVTGLGCAQDFPQVFSNQTIKEVAKAEKRFALTASTVIS